MSECRGDIGDFLGVHGAFVWNRRQTRSMFKRVLAPMNGSQNTERILPYLAQVTNWCDSELTLLHVLRPTRDRSVGDLQIEYPNVLTDRAQSLAREYFAELSKQFESVGVITRSTTASGDLVDTVVARASVGSFDLMALAVAEAIPAVRHLMESPSEKIRVRSPIPMLILNGQQARKSDRTDVPLSRLLIALNGTKVSELALPYARQLARAGNASITLIRIVPEVSGFHQAALLGSTAPRFVESAIKKAEQYLKNKAGGLAQEGFDVSTRVLVGPVARTLIDVQNSEPEHLLVIGSRVRSGWQRAILGSTSDEIVRISGRPLLLIPAGKNPAPSDSEESEPTASSRRSTVS